MTPTPSVTIKNKSLKMSPAGLITLPVSARRALGMTKGAHTNVEVRVEKGTIVVSPATGSNGMRVSPRGMMTLPPEAQQVLASAASRHYWFEAWDATRRIVLHPFQ